MFMRIATWRAVTIAAMLTTLAAIVISLGMVYQLFHGQDRRAAMTLSPIITFVITMPFSFFIWAQVRQNVLLNKELQRLVNRDRLTDVATRDFFFAKMKDDPGAYGISLMVDIDHFKAVNDTYGHLAGDRVISRVADILHENTRANDIVCRFGGEEFVVFLKDQGETSGYEVAERMRQMIAADQMRFDEHLFRVTVSIGGSLKDRLASIDMAIKQADQALYRAKTGGRNRTVFATPPDTAAA